MTRTGTGLERLLGALARLDGRLRRGEVGPGGEAALMALIASGLIGWMLLKLPMIARAEGFLFMDWGSNLTVQALGDQGDEAGIDYFYPYGLAPLVIGRAWFALSGRTPAGYLALVAVLHAMVSWGLARGFLATRAGLAGLALLVLALPWTVYPCYPSIAHGVEAVLLVWMLAELARGRAATALAIATACLFVKPSMAYVAGAVLVGLSFLEWLVRRPASWGRAVLGRFGPSVLVGVLVSVALSVLYRPGLVLRTLLPTNAASLYPKWNYGFFFGGGRNFWAPPGVTLGTYLGTHRGFWIASTLVLLAGGLAGFWRLVRAWRAGEARGVGASAMVVAAAVMHVAFVSLFYAGEVSWLYYAYLLILGTSAVAAWGGGWTAVVLALAVLAAGADRGLPREIRDGWRQMGFRPSVAGLWMEPAAASEWRQALGWTEGRPSAVLAMAGCAPLIYPRFAPDVSLFLIPGMEGSRDAHRKAAVMRDSEIVVVPTRASQSRGVYEFLRGCPEFQDMFSRYDLVMEGKYYEVYRRPSGRIGGEGGSR